MVVSANRFLTLEEMTVNANYIFDYLTDKGWSKNAISGMLGNMQTESTINPGIWQDLQSGNTSLGFGLVQWTPATKYINWANANGFPYQNIDSQLKRIEWEIANNEQWIATSEYNLSFKAFTTSNQSPEWLGQAFLKNYERPANQNQPERSTQARYWYENLIGGSGGGKPHFPTTDGLPITSKYGWRIDPVNGGQQFHSAIDIGGNGVNHPIYATQSGKVIYNQFTDYGGWTIRIEHSGDEYLSQYQHMSIKSPISIGSIVNKGQNIGTMGTTGDSTGIHLDFMVAISNTGWFTEMGTIDPELYLQMEFGENPNPEPEPNDNIYRETISMLLSDTLNGWKW